MSVYCQLAKKAVESFKENGIIIKAPKGLPAEMLESKAGVFVTIKKQGQLRGCMGTAAPCCENIAQEIIENSVAAASRDNRFEPVAKNELPELVYEVSVLGKLEPVNPAPQNTASTSPRMDTKIIQKRLSKAKNVNLWCGVKNTSELNPKKYGVLIRTTASPFKSGLLLPDLEGIDTTKQQIAIACAKAGIDPSKEQIIIYRFQVKKYAQ